MIPGELPKYISQQSNPAGNVLQQSITVKCLLAHATMWTFIPSPPSSSFTCLSGEA